MDKNNRSYKTPYLISNTTLDVYLCYIPDITVIACFAPYFRLEYREGLDIYIQCSNGAAIHVIPELKAWTLCGWISWASQVSCVTRI